MIGHSGRGGYGHGLDVAWRRILGVEIVGIADPDKEGCQKALDRLKLNRGYSDYRKMLQETLRGEAGLEAGRVKIIKNM